SSFHSLNFGRQHGANLVIAQTRSPGQATRQEERVELVGVSDRSVRRGGRANLHTDGVANHGSQVDVEILNATGALTNPQLMRGEIEQLLVAIVFRKAQHSALVVNNQRLMRAVNLRGLQVRVRNTTGSHELQC